MIYLNNEFDTYDMGLVNLRNEYIMKANEKFYKDNDRPYDEWYVQQYENWREKHDKRK